MNIRELMAIDWEWSTQGKSWRMVDDCFQQQLLINRSLRLSITSINTNDLYLLVFILTRSLVPLPYFPLVNEFEADPTNIIRSLLKRVRNCV